MNPYEDGQSGVIIGKQLTDFIAGSNSPIVFKEKLSSGNWLEFKPEHELQNKGFETYACTVFSALDCIETLFMFDLRNGNVPPETVRFLRDHGYFKNGFINFSDRLPANFADIQIGLGTYQYKTNDAVRHYLVPEDMFPYTTDKYYDQTQITQQILALIEELKDHITINWFWVEDPELYLKMSPLQSIVRYADGEGVLKPNGPKNHSVMTYDIDSENTYINDSYTRELKIYGRDYVDQFVGYLITYNKKNNMVFKKTKSESHIYMIDEVNKTKTMIIDMPTLNVFSAEVEEVDSLSYYADAGTLVWTERIIN